MAIDIDGICHRPARAASGCTVEVLGSGLANVYPLQHRRLAEQIVEQGGAVVSDYLVTDLPFAAHFPQRNRILSGLSLGVLVIKASLRSGTLITAAMRWSRAVRCSLFLAR